MRKTTHDYIDSVEKFEVVCKEPPLTPEFARTCSSAVTLLARTVSSSQIINQVFGALCEDQENMVEEKRLVALATEVLLITQEMQAAQAIVLLSRVLSSITFTEYLTRLKIQQSKH